MSDQPLDDVLTLGESHYLSQADWDAVVLEAERLHDERLAIPGGGAGFAPLGLTPKFVDERDGLDKSSDLRRVQLFVIHTGETPLRVGYAEALTTWASKGRDPRVSWRAFVDPATIVRWIPRTRAAWHATLANRISLGYEQSGYAAFSRATWLQPDGLRQLDLLAQQIVADKLPAAGLRWLTDEQVEDILAGRDTTTVGLCTHAQINPKTRTDPGRGYPKDVLLDFLRHYHPAFAKPKPRPTAPKEARIMHTLVRLKGGAVWLSDFIQRRYIAAAELEAVKAGLRARGIYDGVNTVTSLAPYGVVVGPEPKP